MVAANNIKFTFNATYTLNLTVQFLNNCNLLYNCVLFYNSLIFQIGHQDARLLYKCSTSVVIVTLCYKSNNQYH